LELTVGTTEIVFPWFFALRSVKMPPVIVPAPITKEVAETNPSTGNHSVSRRLIAWPPNSMPEDANRPPTEMRDTPIIFLQLIGDIPNH